jgi:hypothetical protein
MTDGLNGMDLSLWTFFSSWTQKGKGAPIKGLGIVMAGHFEELFESFYAYYV